ncbi:hypothetical protein HJFPF1_08724 [Paramyrothecium foliicola]|nr:hypothetical protein HJFPF1_08724 [Paramyrothecium foliicola]
MGQQYSAPQQGSKLRVIGTGLPRTGTASFSRALEILLNGPVYHGGTQVTLGPEAEVKTWIKLLSQWPPTNDRNHKENLHLLKSRLDGFVAITDSPGCSLIPELCALYPDAKVICTIRDPEAWEKSMQNVGNASTQWFLRFVLFPLPSLRFFVDYIDMLRPQWYALYGETEPVTTKSWHRHMAWLAENVPRDRLIFFDVKDGWDPLCQALELPVPEDIPFPRINDGQQIEAFAKRHVTRGLVQWIKILATLVTAVFLLLYLKQQLDGAYWSWNTS